MMQFDRILLLIAGGMFIITATAQNVGIGTTTPHSSARLHVADTTKGVLTPRMTRSQRNSILSPAEGLLVYQTDTLPGFYYYTGAEWTQLYDTLNTDAPLTGDGSASNPLQLAQQGATSGDVLKWNGTGWTPSIDVNTDSQDLGYNNLSAPTSNYVDHQVTITNGSNINVRDYYAPNTTVDGCGGCLDIGVEVNGASTTARLTGDGSSGSPLDLAQQGASPGNVLKWDGSSWAPAPDDTGSVNAFKNVNRNCVYSDASDPFGRDPVGGGGDGVVLSMSFPDKNGQLIMVYASYGPGDWGSEDDAAWNYIRVDGTIVSGKMQSVSDSDFDGNMMSNTVIGMYVGDGGANDNIEFYKDVTSGNMSGDGWANLCAIGVEVQ